MADPAGQSLDALVERYKAKAWTYVLSCSRGDRISLLIVLAISPPAWYGLIYWMIKDPAIKYFTTNTTMGAANGRQFAFIFAVLIIVPLPLVMVISQFGMLLELLEHVFCAVFVLPPLWIVHKCIQAISFLRLLVKPMSRVCTIRKRRNWDNVRSLSTRLCQECQRIVTRSTLLNGSILGVVYPVEKYRHHNLTALTFSAQQCHLCRLFLNSMQNRWEAAIRSIPAEKKPPQIEVELKVVKKLNGYSCIHLRLHCSTVPGYLTMTVEEIHKSKPGKLCQEINADFPRPKSLSIRN
jgi:hypothetical protein